MTQLEQVKRDLREGRKVTSMAMFDKGITRLSEYIRVLRNQGWLITTNLQPSKNRGGRYASYILESDG